MWIALSLALIVDEIPTKPRPQEIPSKIVTPGTPAPPPPPAPPRQDDLDGAARALREAQEAIRGRHTSENQGVGQLPGIAQTGALEKKLMEEARNVQEAPPVEPAVPPTPVGGDSAPQDIAAERARMEALRAKMAPEAARLLAEARVKRAEQMSELFGDASRPLNLPLDLSAAPPRGDLKNYPLYLPRRPLPEVFHVTGTRSGNNDIAYMAHRAAVEHERRHLEEWTAARALATADKGYEERWADSVLAVKSATAGR